MEADLFIILDIDQTPFEPGRKSSWLLLDILDMFKLINGAFFKWSRGGSAKLRNGLCSPELLISSVVPEGAKVADLVFAQCFGTDFGT